MKKIIALIYFGAVLISCCGTKQTAKSHKTVSDEIVHVEAPKSLDKNTVTPSAPSNKLDVIEDKINDTPIPPKLEHTVEEIETREMFSHASFNHLLQTYVSTSGKVNYNGFKSSKTSLTQYIKSLGDNMPNESWTKEEKLAYWINAYNAMTIDLILRNPGIKSIKDIDKPWEQRFWKLDKKWYNLDEIEHQILRKMDEPRIHFAIVCASVSCPKLQNRAFTALDLESQLSNATKEFLLDSSKNRISKNSVKLSKIFKWFAKDFKQNQSLVDFLNKYTDIEIAQNASKSFMDYNWNLND